MGTRFRVSRAPIYYALNIGRAGATGPPSFVRLRGARVVYTSMKFEIREFVMSAGSVVTTRSSATTSLTRDHIDDVYKALASDQRREIIRMLAECGAETSKTCCGIGEVCACKISERLDLVPSTISHHMSVLRSAGIVTARKEGTWVYYTLQRDVLRAAAQELLGI